MGVLDAGQRFALWRAVLLSMLALLVIVLPLYTLRLVAQAMLHRRGGMEARALARALVDGRARAP